MNISVTPRSLITVPVDERGEFPIEEAVDARLILDRDTDCTSCGSAGCHTSGCPMNNNIPEINDLFQRGMTFLDKGNEERGNHFLKKAFETSWQTNRWGLLTGRLCPSDKLCEDGCYYRHGEEGSILIRGIEYATHDAAWKNDWIPPLEQKEKLGKSIAIVGSGFAAIAAAEMAFELGYDVTIYERGPVAGGLGAVGIPRLKMAFDDVKKYTDRLEQAGIVIKTNTTIGAHTDGSTIGFDSLADSHDAVMIATGKYQPKIAIDSDHGGDHMTQAIDFLSRQSLNNINQPHEYDDVALDAKDKRVIVIGGGDTAMDCVRTAKTIQGAKSSICLYRGDESRIRAGKKELQAANEEGVEFQYNAQPTAIVKNKDGSLTVHCEDGRTFDADMVISAVGFDPENVPTLFGQDNLPVHEKYGSVVVEEESQIIIPGTGMFGKDVGTPTAGFVTDFKTASGKKVPLFAAGDIVSNKQGYGPSLAVHALAGGRDIVGLIHTHLTNG